MKKINITIDGKKVQVDSGITILKAARDNNITNIPTLCYDPELPPYGSCFLCVVEVEGFPRLIPACSSPVGEGMVIKTNSEKVIDTRKTALELLLSEHFADCDAPCEQECPAHVDVQGYIALISRGLHREAIELIRKTNPLPVTCGRICVRKCEIKCRRSIIDETAVGINYLKRYASDVERNIHNKETVKEKRTENIAIVGGGPSGLTAAYFLAKEGYRIAVFDMMPKLGGMLRYGIPEYRLPKKLLDQEIQFILDLGVEVKMNMKLGVDFTIESLKKDGYKSIFLALGAWKSQSMRLPQEDKLQGVISGIKYLRENQMGTGEKLSGNIIIVGGGNTAIDAARSSLREKEVKEVTIIYRRTKKEMPADPIEIHAAEEEGVKFEFLVSPLELISNKKLEGIKCQKMELGDPDSSGRRRPVPIKGTEFDIQCDILISAIGQKADVEDISVELSRWGTVAVNEYSLQSSIEGVFAGGDVVLGPSVVIDAIAHGQRAAKSISQFLQTGKVEKTKIQFQSRRDFFGEIPRDYYQDVSLKGRTKMNEEPVEKRIKDNSEVELGISDDDVAVESSRCLECGCLINDSCILRKYCTEYEIDISEYKGEIRISNIDNSHPFISLDQNKCILCGRCVRTCNEIVGSGVYGFVDRGFYTEVRPTLDRNLVETECISCGNCIDACPTGAILQSNPDVKPVPRSVEKLPLNCGYCSIGCEMYLDFTPGGLQRVSSDRDGNIEGPGKGLLCFNGRFGLSYAVDKNRIIKPFIKKENKYEEVSLDNALEIIHAELKDIIKKYGPESIGFFASPKMTLEEYYLLRKLSNHIGTDNFGSLNYLLSGIDLQELNTSCGFTSSYARFEDLENSDYIVAFGSIEKKNPVAAMRINIAINNGAELFLINPVGNSTLEKKATLVFRFQDNSEKYLFASLIRQVSESKISNWDLIEKKTNGFFELKESVQNMSLRKLERKTGILRRFLKKFLNSLSDDSKNVVIIINPDDETLRSEQTLSLITSYMIISGRFFRDNNGLIMTRSHSNSQGIAFTFINDNPYELQEMIKTQKIKAAIIFGENPLVDDKFRKVFENINFLVSCEMFNNEITSISDVILPFSAYFESDGSFITSENRLKIWNKVIESPTGSTNFEIIKSLAEKFNCEVEDDINTIRRNILNEYKLDDIILAEDMNIDNNNIFKNEKFPTFDGKANLWPFNEKTPSVKVELNKYVSLDKWLEQFKNNNSIT